MAVDASTGEIAAHVLTEGTTDDAAQVPALLGQAKGSVASLIADGAHDGEPVYRACAARQPKLPPEVVIPPRMSTVLSTDDPEGQTARDRHIRLMAEKGRMGWKQATGYGRRNHVETAIGRCDHLIGPKLRARSLLAQQAEAAIAVAALNRMTRTAKPVRVRRA